MSSAICRPDRKALRLDVQKFAEKRILIIDGAMGTEIQGLKLNEAQFRGQRFAACRCDQKGNNDLLILTQPEAVEEIHLR